MAKGDTTFVYMDATYTMYQQLNPKVKEQSQEEHEE